MDRFLVRFIVMLGFTSATLIALTVVVTSAIVPLMWPELKVPEHFVNWGGVIIGFYFGSFINLASDLMGLRWRQSNPGENALSARYEK